LGGCKTATVEVQSSANPIFNAFNQPIDFAAIRADHIIEATAVTKDNTNKMIGDIVAIPITDKTFENTMVVLDNIYDEINGAVGIIRLMSVAHPDSLIRITAQEKETELSQFENEVTLNEILRNKKSRLSTEI